MEAEEDEDYHSGKRGNPCPSSSSTSLLRLGKKVAIAGAAITSAPVVLPPLLLFSALGAAFAFPFGVYFAGFFYTEKLMRSLLPSPQDTIGNIIDSDQEDEQMKNNDLEMVEEEEVMEVEGEGETKGKQVAGEEVGIEMWPPISIGVGEEEDKQGETEERIEAIGETEEEENLILVEGKGERNERKEVENEMLPPTFDERLVSKGDRIVPSISTQERMGATREEEEKAMLVEGKGGRNEGEEVENDMLPPNIVMPSARNAQLEENAIEPNTEHESSIKDVEVGEEFVRLQYEEIMDVVSSRGCGNVGNVEIETEVQPMGRSEMEGKEVEEKVENKLSIAVSCPVENKGEGVEVISEAKPSEAADIEKSRGDGYVIEKDGNDKDIFVTETMEEEEEKQYQGIEFAQRNNVESIIEQSSYAKRIETVVLIETEEMTGENVMGGEGNEEDMGRPDAEVLATICNSFGPAVTSSGSTNEIEMFTKSSDYASAIEDRLSEMTDAESGNIAVVETVLYSDNEGLDCEERIWEQIYALRTIVGYKASPPSSLGDELRALYLFTGVEPPVSLRNTSDLEEVSDKLRFLKAVVGVK